MVVHDIPLLVETGQGRDFDLVVTIEAPLASRLERLVDGRGLSRADAMARVEAQASDAERADAADAILDGGASVDQLRAAVDDFWVNHVPGGKVAS